jgi:hypothetical protein
MQTVFFCAVFRRLSHNASYGDYELKKVTLSSLDDSSKAGRSVKSIQTSVLYSGQEESIFNISSDSDYEGSGAQYYRDVFDEKKPKVQITGCAVSKCVTECSCNTSNGWYDSAASANPTNTSNVYKVTSTRTYYGNSNETKICYKAKENTSSGTDSGTDTNTPSGTSVYFNVAGCTVTSKQASDGTYSCQFSFQYTLTAGTSNTSAFNIDPTTVSFKTSTQITKNSTTTNAFQIGQVYVKQGNDSGQGVAFYDIDIDMTNASEGASAIKATVDCHLSNTVKAKYQIAYLGEGSTATYAIDLDNNMLYNNKSVILNTIGTCENPR